MINKFVPVGINKVSENILFSSLTTLRIGGPIKYFVEALTITDIVQSIERAKKENLLWIVIGGGSNLLVADSGFDGLVIQNCIEGIKKLGEIMEVSSGTDLKKLVDWVNSQGFSGFEKLAGIPGTVGGAVYGNAGAYGQTISDKILWVEVYSPGYEDIKILRYRECGFGYRDSGFKKTKDIILRIGFSATPGDSEELIAKSREIIKTREQKYHRGIACPGSFFKNVEVDKLDEGILRKIPKDKIMFGKIPAGWLLEEVGAKGGRRGHVKVAPWHGNLFINEGGGRTADFVKLAGKYKDRVKEKFGIELVPEVQLIGFKNSEL